MAISLSINGQKPKGPSGVDVAREVYRTVSQPAKVFPYFVGALGMAASAALTPDNKAAGAAVGELLGLNHKGLSYLPRITSAVADASFADKVVGDYIEDKIGNISYNDVVNAYQGIKEQVNGAYIPDEIPDID